jgi:dihydrodipicolinate synthase/N-acetylneuraminate lyase
MTVNAVLLQDGAIGCIAVLAIIAVKVMFNQTQKTFDRERERADRLEEELRRLNDMVRSEYLNTISAATRAIADALAAIRRGPPHE